MLTITNQPTEQGTELLVDSRLIAETLGVEHRYWINRSMKHFTDDVKSVFGHPFVKNTTVTNSVGAVNQVNYYMLTEDQATFLMTLSRNTPQVIAAKAQLVKAFSQAKKLLLQPPTPTPEPIVLKPAIERVDSLYRSLEFFQIDISNPRFKQPIQDLVLDTLRLGQPVITGAVNSDQWLGVAERAEQLGYPTFLIASRRSQLGKHVKGLVPDTDRTKESRVCNGTQRPINVYRLTEQLDHAIQSYFDSI